MGFFDEFQDTGAGNWVKKPEKDELIASGQTFPVQRVDEVDSPQYGERFVVTTTLPTGENGEDEERKISFPKGSGVESRDRMLEAIAKWLDDPANEPPQVKLYKVKQSILIADADADNA